MASKALPDLAYLVECFECDPESGTLVWKLRPRHHFRTQRGYRCYVSHRSAGKRADWFHNPTGYRFVHIGYSLYKAHRIIWKMATGCEPGEALDHINEDRSDNRISNLREATDLQNRYNTGKRRHNTSGLKGVFYQHGYPCARIGIGGKSVWLGSFNTPEEAKAAYDDAARKLHGEFFHED